jgi:hypothetical protein
VEELRIRIAKEETYAAAKISERGKELLNEVGKGSGVH